MIFEGCALCRRPFFLTWATEVYGSLRISTTVSSTRCTNVDIRLNSVLQLVNIFCWGPWFLNLWKEGVGIFCLWPSVLFVSIFHVLKWRRSCFLFFSTFFRQKSFLFFNWRAVDAVFSGPLSRGKNWTTKSPLDRGDYRDFCQVIFGPKSHLW